jgi:hypothetical protein
MKYQPKIPLAERITCNIRKYEGETQPFTYLIGWSKQRLFYYGVKYAKFSNPADLWMCYFTSSIFVDAARREFGEPDIRQVRRTFKHSDAARLWERKVLKRMKVVDRSDFLNRTDHEVFSREKTAAHIEKIAAKLRGRKLSPEHIAKMSHPREGGWKLSEETKKKQSSAKRGILKTTEHKRKIAESVSKLVQTESTRAKRAASLTGKKKSPAHIAAVIAAKRRNKERRQQEALALTS